MGSSSAFIGYGFSIDTDGREWEGIENLLDKRADGPTISDLLESTFFGQYDYGHFGIVVYVTSTQTMTWEGDPKPFDPSLGKISREEWVAIEKAHAYIDEIIREDDDYMEEYSPKPTEIAWIVWGNYG